ncbi:DUF6456 domain-containing protein [Arenibacterium sp. CAU 1754]
MTRDASGSSLPIWVPDTVQRYLLHTELGHTIRDLAREAGCYASTVLRQIRRIETRRDDPLVDAALKKLAQTLFASPASRLTAPGGMRATVKEPFPMTSSEHSGPDTLNASELSREASRILRRLCESGAVLAVAENMEKAVVVRDDDAGPSARTAVVDTSVAQAMALKDWIACVKPGRISRYHITAAGRSALSRMLAEQENRMRKDSEHGFAEAQTPFGGQRGNWGEKTMDDPVSGRQRKMRYNMAESPLIALARRKDKDGKPFLDDSLVHAGERLREDFELSQMGTRIAQNWDRFLTGGARGGFAPDSAVCNGPSAARDRVARALSDLGPGLSDVALRCCCFLEGLETAEKQLGWSARSGKIVLRIALQRLNRHYEEQSEPSRMIG